MKKIITIFLFFISLNSFAQSNLRQFKGVKSIGINTYLSDNGFGYGLFGSLCISKKFNIEQHFIFDYTDFVYTKGNQYLLQTNVTYNVMNFLRDFYFYTSTGLLYGNEILYNKAESYKINEFSIYGNINLKLKYYYKNYGFYYSIQQNIGKSLICDYYIQNNIGFVYVFNNIFNKDKKKFSSANF